MSTSHSRRLPDVLVLIDVQNDFCPQGALAVPDGDLIIPNANRLIARFPHVVLTQDWHPPGHSSFASSHPGRAPLDSITASYGAQVMWPDHCVQGTHGAQFHEKLETARAELILRKGFHRDIDSYSAFFENDRKTPTGLTGYLRERGFASIAIAGLAFDFCVRFSCEDAHAMGFVVTAVEDACRSIGLGDSINEAHRALAARGIERVRTDDVVGASA